MALSAQNSENNIWKKMFDSCYTLKENNANNYEHVQHYTLTFHCKGVTFMNINIKNGFCHNFDKMEA